MFCPRCGRPVSDTANFCGGCGLPKAEIERMIKEKSQRMQTPVIPPVDTDDIHSTIERLENDLSGASPVIDYTTDMGEDTNTTRSKSDFLQNELEEEKKAKENEDAGSFYGQSRYSRNAPKSPFYEPSSSYEPIDETPNRARDTNLSTVDFIWIKIISGLPVIGLIYLIWLAFFRTDNPNKTSYARATLIISVFATVLAIVFTVGVIVTQVAMFY